MELSPELLISAYAQGLFPMAQSKESPDVEWICPRLRGQISIKDMHIPKRLAKSVRQMKLTGAPYEIKINAAFSQVIENCAKCTAQREATWINQEIISAFTKLHELGLAHSVECWQRDKLAGGLYGLALGGAFFGESMFSLQRDASKVALVHLVARLHYAQFDILDIQFINDHLLQFGAYEIVHQKYMKRLEFALQKRCNFERSDVNEKTLIEHYFRIRNSAP
ncbi:MAG: leucyl/phenylalanyl-tRNA--protein transferase [Alphaproteobacteria bacterium]